MFRRHPAWFITVLSLVVLLPAAGTRAQDASPSAGPPARDLALLKGLGLPEIAIVATDADVTGVPTELAAGRYLVTVENRTADLLVGGGVLAVPAGTTDEDARQGILGEGLPAWFYEATWAGGPIAGAGQTDAAVVEFAAGDVAGAVPVDLTEYAFAFPATLPAGPQIWQLTNTATQPHLLDLAGVPVGTTFGQLMEFLGFVFTGTPAASALGFDRIRDLYATPNLSPGQTTWVEIDLAPGTYAVACFVPDRASQAPHALMGMVQVFTVA